MWSARRGLPGLLRHPCRRLRCFLALGADDAAGYGELIVDHQIESVTLWPPGSNPIARANSLSIPLAVLGKPARRRFALGLAGSLTARLPALRGSRRDAGARLFGASSTGGCDRRVNLSAKSHLS